MERGNIIIKSICRRSRLIEQNINKYINYKVYVIYKLIKSIYYKSKKYKNNVHAIGLVAMAAVQWTHIVYNFNITISPVIIYTVPNMPLCEYIVYIFMSVRCIHTLAVLFIYTHCAPAVRKFAHPEAHINSVVDTPKRMRNPLTCTPTSVATAIPALTLR